MVGKKITELCIAVVRHPKKGSIKINILPVEQKNIVVYPSLWLAIVAPNVLLFQLQWRKGQQIRYDWLDLGGLFVVYNLTPRPSYSFSAGNSKPPVVTSGDWLRIQGQKKPGAASSTQRDPSLSPLEIKPGPQKSNSFTMQPYHSPYKPK